MAASPQHKSKLPGVRPIGAGMALLAVVAVVAVIVSQTDSSPSRHNTNREDSTFDASTVKRRDLVATDIESGTLSHASPQTVYNRLSGTLTWLPSAGQVVKPGATLFKVDGEPVILMNGKTPAYRELTSSDSPGQDILELNRNLVALGLDPDGIVVDDEWQAATTAGVQAFQASLAEPETGSLTLGQVVFLPGTRIVSTVDATLGSTAGSSGLSNPSTSGNASDPKPGIKPQLVSLETPAAPKHESGHSPGANHALKALITLLQADIAELKAAKGSPSSNSGSPSSNGASASGGGGSATPILETTSTRRIVTVHLDPSKQSEAKIAARVTVEMPSGNAVDGRVSAVSSVAQTSSNVDNGSGSGNSGNNNNTSSNSGSTIPVTVTLPRRHSGAGLDQASVSVNFAQARANHVLSVPVTALLATAGGGYAVQAAAAPHKLIPVKTGLFAAGYVQISGRGTHPGLRVTDSQG